MKFKVGDRVNVYGGIHGIDNKTVYEGAKYATVIDMPGDLLSVEFDDKQDGDYFWAVHRKQCRKLKKTTSKYYYLNQYSDGHLGGVYTDRGSAEASGCQQDNYVRTIKLKRVK